MSNGENTVRHYVSIYQIARELDVHSNSIKRFVRAGEFPKPTRIDGRLYFARDRVQAHLQKLEREGRSLRRRRPRQMRSNEEIFIIEPSGDKESV